MNWDFDKVQGRGTYLMCIIMGIVGVAFLFRPGVASWTDPSGDYVAAVSKVVGWLMIITSLSTWRLRLALSRMEARLAPSLGKGTTK